MECPWYSKFQATEKKLEDAVEKADEWMKNAPYLCWDLAKELIKAAKEVLDNNRTGTV